MTFADSIRTCFAKYADFNGCASRSEFWWWTLFVALAAAALNYIGPTVSGIFSVATLLPSIAVAARRLHDTDRSGWMQLIGLIPLVGWILVLIWYAQDSKRPSRYAAGEAGIITG